MTETVPAIGGMMYICTLDIEDTFCNPIIGIQQKYVVWTQLCVLNFYETHKTQGQIVPLQKLAGLDSDCLGHKYVNIFLKDCDVDCKFVI